MQVDLHGAEVTRITRERPPITVGASSIIGLVGSAPDAQVAAAAAVTLGAGNAGVRFTADAAGRAGNAITVALVDPQVNGAALAITVVGRMITVNLATSNAGRLTTTATQLKTAINADAGASALVTAVATGTGADVVAVAPATPLAGGVDALLPLNTPVLLATAAQAGALGDSGALPAAVRDVYRTAGQAGAAIVVVRTADDAAATLAGSAANKTGIYALLSAESVTGQRPRLIAAPGAQDDSVTTALQAVAADLHAVAVVTLTAADVAAAVTAGPDLSHVMACWPQLVVVEDGREATRPADALVCGHVARIDREFSFAASPSNHLLHGVLRPAVGGELDDRRADQRRQHPQSRAPRDGHSPRRGRLAVGEPAVGWHADPKRRADDVIGDRLLDAVLDYLDRRVDVSFVEHVTGRMSAYIRTLVVQGHIRAGRAWFDPAHNDAATLASAMVTFSFELSLHDIAEHIQIRSSVSSIPNDIIEQLTAGVGA